MPAPFTPMMLRQRPTPFDGEGCPDFVALMRRRGPPCQLAFDLVAHAGRDLRDEQLEHRKDRLAELLAGRADRALQNTEGIAGEGVALFGAIRDRGMEGIIAKRLGSRYVPGRRTAAWIKIKVPGYAPDRRDWFEQSGRAPAPA